MEKKFEHSLEVDDIVLRQDTDSESESIISISGYNYPVVRIKETVIDYGNINNITLKINDNLLPLLTLSINDTDKLQTDQNFIEANDIITIAIGNLKDENHHIIKNNYFVTSAENNENGNYSINALLDVQGLYVSVNRVFVNKSSLEVLEHIAKECQLGFITNISDSEDNMNWIQHQNNIDFIGELKNTMWCGEKSRIEIFVDQYANLNVIDVTKALEESYNTTFITDVEGNELEEDTEFRAKTWYDGTDDKYFASLKSYSPINNYGYYSRRYPSKIEIEEFKLESNILGITELKSDKDVLKENSDLTIETTTNTYENYRKSIIKNLYNKHIYDSLILNCNFDNYYPQMFMYLTFDIEIYNTKKLSSLESQDENIDNDNIEEEVQPKEESFTNELNEKSGKYMIIGMSINFTFISGEESIVTQNITVIKKP